MELARNGDGNQEVKQMRREGKKEVFEGLRAVWREEGGHMEEDICKNQGGYNGK